MNGRSLAERLHMEAVFDLLTSRGFVADGATRSETVRVPTSRSPVLGKSGGEVRTFGGRQRLALPGTNVRVTVGSRTVFLYRVFEPGGNIETIAHVRTHDVEELRIELAKLGGMP